MSHAAFFTTALVVSLTLSSPAMAKAKERPKPDPKEIISIIYANLDAPLKPTFFGCSMPSDLPPNPKVRDYMAFLTSVLASAGANTEQKLTAQCQDPQDGPLGPTKHPEKYWDCELNFRTTDKAREPWQYGIYFRMTRSDRKMDRNQIACPGTP